MENMEIPDEATLTLKWRRRELVSSLEENEKELCECRNQVDSHEKNVRGIKKRIDAIDAAIKKLAV
jgi:hypothetical protein